MSKIKVSIVQMNPICGGIKQNYEKMLDIIKNKMNKFSVTNINGIPDIIIFPESSISGYPNEDLVHNEEFVDLVDKYVDKLIDDVHNLSAEWNIPISIIFGAPLRIGVNSFTNSAILIDTENKNGDKATIIDKYELPNYGVFDEKRIYTPSQKIDVINWRGLKMGLMICEDAWFPTVSAKLKDQGANFLISINGSPFEVNKKYVREKVIIDRIKETQLPFAYVNMVGGQDEIVFDGGSFIIDAVHTQNFPTFKEGVWDDIIHVNDTTEQSYKIETDELQEIGIPKTDILNFNSNQLADIYRALVLGTRDYFRKQGFKSAVLGYSGGVDSGLVAAIACDAIGPENVHLVRLPSKYSSTGSLTDAAAGAKRLGANLRTIEIEPVVEALRAAYKNANCWFDYTNTGLTGIADENIQARARGTILMSISNQEGHILLSTGNKSEVSVGYSTIYGDMCGGFNPIKDCYKVVVWALCRYRNGLTTDLLKEYDFLGNSTEVVPEEIISKPPSAELRPDQKDEDSLPPYPVLDALLFDMVDLDKSNHELYEKFDPNTVNRIRSLVFRSEYKRRQAAPGIKISSKLHGRDRRFPIVNGMLNI